MTTINKYNNPYKVMASGSGWGLWKKIEGTADNYTKIENFGSRSWDRIRALEIMFQLNGWSLPKGGLH